ncbi:MAG: hypothetical protein L0216_08995 [Planctomycetales bacterium]|nr:hypothetical protein [Planctomycetales bacterium]
MRIRTIVALAAALSAGACGSKTQTPPSQAGTAPAAAPGEGGKLDPALLGKVRAAVGKAQAFLYAAQDEGGGWQDPGYTAMAATALLRATPGATRASHPKIWKALDNLTAFQKPDGAIFAQGNANYVTSVSVMAFLASKDPAYRPAAEKAARYVGEAILDEGEGASPKGNVFYGGSGYEKRRPDQTELYADLSNTSYTLEALDKARAEGIPINEKALEAARVFLERCQHRTESGNASAWASDDPQYAGGFVYHPKDSKAGEVPLPDGRKLLLPYGSMTYAGIKSFIHARVGRDDPRVKAAVDWIRKNYTLERNPGFDITRSLDQGARGLFYYFDTYAKAHQAIGEDVFVDSKGVKHAWRAEIAEALLARQRPDGSWVNEKDEHWMEGNPVLATSYALLALAYGLGG